MEKIKARIGIQISSRRLQLSRWVCRKNFVVADVPDFNKVARLNALSTVSTYYVIPYYSGPSSPVETPDPIRPQARIATAWWAEGWFKIVVAIGGLIIVAILVATFIVVGRNNNRKEQVFWKVCRHCEWARVVNCAPS